MTNIPGNQRRRKRLGFIGHAMMRDGSSRHVARMSGLSGGTFGEGEREVRDRALLDATAAAATAMPPSRYPGLSSAISRSGCVRMIIRKASAAPKYLPSRRTASAVTGV